MQSKNILFSVIEKCVPNIIGLPCFIQIKRCKISQIKKFLAETVNKGKTENNFYLNEKLL